MSKENIPLIGAEMALDDAVKKMRQSVHPTGCDDGKNGDDVHGRALAGRIRRHCKEIQETIEYWNQCLEYRDKIKEGPKAPVPRVGFS